MNVAVLTFIYADNYGALLQAYALKKIVENAGNSIVFLDYIPESEKKFYEKNYHNIREVVVWENEFRNILKKQLKDKNTQNKDEIESCLNYVNFQKDYRNDRMDKDEWEYYEDEFLYGKVEPIKMQREQISNEKMLELYNEGGIEAVWEGMDADEIYRSESDAANLGIIKRR